MVYSCCSITESPISSGTELLLLTEQRRHLMLRLQSCNLSIKESVDTYHNCFYQSSRHDRGPCREDCLLKMVTCKYHKRCFAWKVWPEQLQGLCCIDFLV